MCGECGKSYNLADINVAADAGRGLPAIVMPPLSPPDKCLSKCLTGCLTEGKCPDWVPD